MCKRNIASEGTGTEFKQQQRGDRVSIKVYDAYRRHNYEEMGNICQTVSSFYGTGGGSEVLVVYGFDSYNQAIFAETSQTLKEHGGAIHTPRCL